MAREVTPSTSPDGRAVRGIWTDGLGGAGMRLAQVLLILVLVVGTVYGLLQIRLLVISLLIALILVGGR